MNELETTYFDNLTLHNKFKADLIQLETLLSTDTSNLDNITSEISNQIGSIIESYNLTDTSKSRLIDYFSENYLLTNQDQKNVRASFLFTLMVGIKFSPIPITIKLREEIKNIDSLINKINSNETLLLAQEKLINELGIDSIDSLQNKIAELQNKVDSISTELINAIKKILEPNAFKRLLEIDDSKFYYSKTSNEQNDLFSEFQALLEPITGGYNMYTALLPGNSRSPKDLAINILNKYRSKNVLSQADKIESEGLLALQKLTQLKMVHEIVTASK